MGIIEFILFCAFLSFRTDILIGVLYGCTFICLNFLYLAYSVKKSVEKNGSGAKAHIAISYNLRLILTAIMIIVAVKVEFIHFWAAIIPLVFHKIVVHILGFISSRKDKGSEIS